MKNLLFILLFFGLKATSQTAFPLYIPTNPDSLKQVVNVNGSPRQVYNIDLIKYRAALTARDTAAALRALIVANTTALSATYNSISGLSDSTGFILNKPNGTKDTVIVRNYSDAQARAAFTLTTTGTSGAATLNSSTGIINIPQYAGATVAGSTSQIQYNNSGAFAGSPNLTWDNTNRKFVIGSGGVTNLFLSMKFNYSTQSGDGAELTGQLNGTDQYGIGFNNGAAFSGTSTQASGRTIYYFDRVASAYRYALDANGTHWYGKTSSDYALKILASTGAAGAQIDGAGRVTSPQYKLSALNTAPVSATDTGTLGEIRITAGFIYVCTATNTWVRAALATF